MGINAYATKIEETTDYVIYSYGSKLDVQTGLLKFVKEELKLVPLKLEGDKKHSRELFKVAIKIEHLYKQNGIFPEKASSQS